MMTLPRSFLFLPAVAVLLSGCGGDSDSNGNFSFKSDAPDRYVRVDRTGQPALATALLSRDPAVPAPGPTGAQLNPGNASNSFNNQRDALNRGDPVNDARDFAVLLTVGAQSNSLRNIHYKVGPQLRALGLTPCSTETATPPASSAQVDISVCAAQAAPVVVPDVITFDLGAPSGWPNGRGFDDPVVDRLLAAALLRISGTAPPHTLNALVGVINPTRDEVNTILPLAFPHLRDRHP
ncbi:hypothetical protein DSM104443_01220 [Usitatibacter rugosus]|uniref:DUF4331 domain-containing protein n=1 Tax=Usitatibacter rugosus TaxID=2732067 RepID=A0A6M4GST1_9PROT|nr:hypothetical protein [Usitatibacter rugosus]QJR10166.1 hypothetical protein DSM104443_01220 [Usitatibacter rugosus]